MSLDSPTTRLSRSPPPTTPSLLASSLFDQTLSETIERIKRKKRSERKGKGQAVRGANERRKRRSSTSQSGDSEEDSEGNESDDSTAGTHPDHPPSYPEAIEQRQAPTRRSRTPPQTRRRSTSSNPSLDDNDGDETDALSNLLDLTTSLLTSSSEILSASKDLHSQLSQFLLSSSPPSGSSTFPSTSTDLLMNDVRSEIGLHGDNWDRLNRLERDVEKFGMKREGKDPRNQLAATSRRSSLNSQPVVGIVTESSMGTLEEEGDSEEQENTGESTTEKVRENSVGLGRPPVQSSSTSVASTSAIVRKGHLRRSSTAKDLLMQISSSSTTASTSTSRPVSSNSPIVSTPSSKHSSSSGGTLDSPSTPSRHRLSISPSLPSLSSSISTSSLSNSTSHPISPSPPLLSSPRNPVSHSSSSKSIPTRGLSVSPSPSSILSLSISTSPVSESQIHTMSLSKSRRPSHSGPQQHRRTSTMSKTGSVAKLDAEDPLGLSEMLENRLDGVVGARERRMSGGGGGTTAAADRLRTLQSGISESSGQSTGGSWWGWR